MLGFGGEGVRCNSIQDDKTERNFFAGALYPHRYPHSIWVTESRIELERRHHAQGCFHRASTLPRPATAARQSIGNWLASSGAGGQSLRASRGARALPEPFRAATGKQRARFRRDP